MLEFIDVKKYYNSNKAVDGISFGVSAGEVLGLIGANGAGKSTTISMIATLIHPDSGHIYYDGRDIVKHPDYMRSRLGFVPQETALYPSLSGKDNLMFWGRANHIRGKQLKERIRDVSRMVGITEEMLLKKVSAYSGGMKRRLNIGAALLHLPGLIVMDEPTAGLDMESRNQIMQAVIRMKEQGACVVYAGHYLEEMEMICDKVCIIDRGRGILFGELKELLSGGGKLEQIYLKAILKAESTPAGNYS